MVADFLSYDDAVDGRKLNVQKYDVRTKPDTFLKAIAAITDFTYDLDDVLLVHR